MIKIIIHGLRTLVMPLRQMNARGQMLFTSWFTLFTVLAIFPMTANAELFKCKKTSGAFVYQDTPCAPGAIKEKISTANEVGAGRAILANSLAESPLVGLRNAARQGERSGRMSNESIDCILALRSSKLQSAFEAALAEEMSASELTLSDAFYVT